MTVLPRLALSLGWALLVCYPDPRVLWRSIKHTLRPPVDPDAVRDWASTLPDDPASIEQAVHERVQYAIPWQKDGVPWTFPSPREVLASGYGDCQCRAVVLASVLAAKGIPHQLRASIDHMWVDYPGKQANDLENDAKLLWARQEPAPGSASPSAAGPGHGSPPAGPPAAAAGATGDHGAGRFQFRLPQVDWAESYRLEKEYFWDPAPRSRKLALAAGLAAIWLWPAGISARPWTSHAGR